MVFRMRKDMVLVAQQTVNVVLVVNIQEKCSAGGTTIKKNMILVVQ